MLKLFYCRNILVLSLSHSLSNQIERASLQAVADMHTLSLCIIRIQIKNPEMRRTHQAQQDETTMTHSLQPTNFKNDAPTSTCTRASVYLIH